MASDADAGEPGNNGSWTFTRTGSTAAPLVVGFTISGTATRVADYFLPGSGGGNTYTIPAGQSSYEAVLSVQNDAIAEFTQTAICAIASSANYIIGNPASALITITDDDGASLPTVTIAATGGNAAEPSTAGTFTVSRSGATTSALTVDFTVTGTATNGVDYSSIDTIVSLAAGQSSVTIPIAPIDDAPVEITETVVLTIISNSNYSIGAASSATLNITDNDSTATWVKQATRTFTTRGSRDLKVDIYLPKNAAPGPLPLFISVPGGGWTNGGRGGLPDAYLNFTAEGFAVASIDYTFSTEAIWPAQIQDCKTAVRWLRANAATYHFDPTRFAVSGISSGGHLATMIGTTGGVSQIKVGGSTFDLVGPNPTNPTQSDAVQAVIPIAPPTHILWADHYPTAAIPDKNGPTSPQSMLVGAPVQTVPELSTSAIPMTYIKPNMPPFFIVHGTADTYVAFNASELLNQALLRAGNNSTFWSTLNGGHDASTFINPENVLLILQFLKRNLQSNTSNALPVPDFTSSITSGPAPLTVNVNASASTDSDGTVTKYAWSFGDDDGAGGVTASFTYNTPGIYPVTLAVRDNLGGCKSITKTITVLASVTATGMPPSVSVTAPSEGLTLTRPEPQLVQANLTDSDGAIVAAEFILDGQSYGFDRLSPFLCIWSDLAVGAHTVAVRGYDSDGNTTLTQPVTFHVQDAVPPPTVTLSSADAAASETPGNAASILFSRNGATTNQLTLNLLFSGTANNGADINSLSSILTIPAGQTQLELIVTPIDDSLVEGSETFAVSLAPSADYQGNTAVGVIITDNDNATPIVTPGIVFATRADGAGTRQTKLNIYRPATGSGPWPTIIYFPGGGWTTQNEGSISTSFRNLTAQGYAVVSANYVSSGFAKWPAQIQDAKAAVRWVRANAATYGFDPDKIGVTGTSSGGHIASYVGVSGGMKTARCGSTVVDLIGGIGGNLTQSDVVQAAAPFFGPADILVMDHYPTPAVPDHNSATSPESSLIGAEIQTLPERSSTVNPIALIRPGLPPFWIVHGTADALVNFNQSELLNAAMVKAGQPTTFWPNQGGGHGPDTTDNAEVHGSLKAFFDRHLKGITTNARPIANFTASTTSGNAPLTVTFDASGSDDPDGVITNYQWSSGDDDGATGVTMTYTYAEPGIYPACLSVRDDQGGTTSRNVNITVNPAGLSGATAPTITITGPTDAFMYARTGDLMLETAIGNGGSNTGRVVTYFLNDQPIAFDNKFPWNTTLGSLPPGIYTATARVSESNGDYRFSNPITFRVFGETDLYPLPFLQNGVAGLSYYRFTDGTLVYSFERSEFLTDWTPLTPTQSILTDGPQIQWMEATDPLSASGADRRFLRIKID